MPRIKVTGRMVLAVPMRPEKNNASCSSIRKYLVTLARKVWEEGESFSGKRPFGDSGWEHEVIDELVRAGLIVDEDDRERADELIGLALDELGRSE